MQNRYSETHTTWNKIAQLYEDMFMELSLYNDTYQEFCDLLKKPQGSILEIGCGPGNITRQILNIHPQLSILATDISENMVELAKKNNSSIHTKVLDCRKIGNLNQKFDGIICGFTVPYLAKQDLLKLISDCSSLLNKQGVFYLSYVEGDYNKSGFISGSSGDRTFFYYYDFQTLNVNLEQNGFSIINITKIKYNRNDGTLEDHIIINAQKSI